MSAAFAVGPLPRKLSLLNAKYVSRVYSTYPFFVFTFLSYSSYSTIQYEVECVGLLPTSVSIRHDVCRASLRPYRPTALFLRPLSTLFDTRTNSLIHRSPSLPPSLLCRGSFFVFRCAKTLQYCTKLAGERGPQHERKPVLLVYRGLPVAGREARRFRQRRGRHGHRPGAGEARVPLGQDKDGEKGRERGPKRKREGDPGKGAESRIVLTNRRARKRERDGKKWRERRTGTGRQTTKSRKRRMM